MKKIFEEKMSRKNITDWGNYERVNICERKMYELKKYKKKRITPQGWKEITLAEAFNTSSGATPLSTEASYYENGTIPWINSGELASPYIYGTTNFISQA